MLKHVEHHTSARSQVFYTTSLLQFVVKLSGFQRCAIDLRSGFCGCGFRSELFSLNCRSVSKSSVLDDVMLVELHIGSTSQAFGSLRPHHLSDCRRRPEVVSRSYEQIGVPGSTLLCLEITRSKSLPKWIKIGPCFQDVPLFINLQKMPSSPAIEARLGIPSIGTVVSIDLAQPPPFSHQFDSCDASPLNLHEGSEKSPTCPQHWIWLEHFDSAT